MNTGQIELLQERITNGVAVGAVASPWWIDSLNGASNLAANILPILGCAWLLMQMIGYYKNKGKK